MSIRVASPSALYRWLNDALIPYAVLRGTAPGDGHAGPAGPDPDIDLLVEDDAVPRIVAAFRAPRRRGGVKCDLYGVRGAAGADYHGYPHLPEPLGRRILATRRLRDRRLYVPRAAEELLALLYHIVYHKNLPSGVHWRDPGRSGDGPYRARLEAVLAELGQTIPFSHEKFHEYLVAHGCGVARGPLIAYTQHDFRHGRKCPFHARLHDELAGEMNLYVVRRVAVRAGRHEELIRRLARRFRIVMRKEIPLTARWHARPRMRGGKWRRGGLPSIAVVVLDEAPVPSRDEERKVHPFVFNRNQFIKHELREWFTATTGRRERDNPVHSTDNEAEAIGHLPLFFSAAEQTRIFERVARVRQGWRDRAARIHRGAGTPA